MKDVPIFPIVMVCLGRSKLGTLRTASTSAQTSVVGLLGSPVPTTLENKAAATETARAEAEAKRMVPAFCIIYSSSVLALCIRENRLQSVTAQVPDGISDIYRGGMSS